MRQVLFVQGGGAGTYDDWDDKLVDSLRRELGDGYEVRYPRMPDEDDPSYATWVPAIRAELEALDDGAVAVGHSLGGILLVQALREKPQPGLRTIALVSTPYVGDGGWPGEDRTFDADLGEHLAGLEIHVFHGLDDDTAPPEHADLYAAAIPQAHVHRLPGRDHQLNDDLTEVAQVITAG